jgi:hypothetical protein
VANVTEAADQIKEMIQEWIDANDLDETLEGAHEIPRAVQEAFASYAERLREDTNLAEHIPEAFAQAAADIQGVADALHEKTTFGVQRS